MAEPLFSVRGLKVALPDMTRKPLIGRAPLAEILKGLEFVLCFLPGGGDHHGKARHDL